MKLNIILISLVFVVLFSCASAQYQPPLAKQLHLRGQPGLDGPGFGQFVFTIEKKQDSNTIQVTMKLNATLLTMETSLQYNKYIYQDGNSNLAEFRYYKSCVSMSVVKPSYSINGNVINIVLPDPSDSLLMYNFKLEKIEISQQEKIDLMFDVMNKDIAELKERLWFLEPGSSNKIAKNRQITSNDNALIEFIEGKTSSFTGIYHDATILKAGKVFLIGNQFTYCASDSYRCDYYYHSLTSSSSQYSIGTFTQTPLTIELPRSATIKKIRFEIANGGSCPYTDTINLSIKRYFVRNSKPTNVVNSGSSYSTWYMNTLDNPSFSITQKKLTDGFVQYELESESYSLVDTIVLFITTNGFKSPSGTVFDGKFYDLTLVTSIAGQSSSSGDSGDGGQALLAKFLFPHAIAYANAGTGSGGFSGDGVLAINAKLYFPRGVSVDPFKGDVYIADSYNNRIRKVSNGFISTIAGTGSAGFTGDGELAIAAKLDTPYSVAYSNTSGLVYILDTNNARIRNIKPTTGFIYTYIGGTRGYSGDGQVVGSQTQIDFSYGISLSEKDDLVIADTFSGAIRVVSKATDIISTLVGDGSGSFSFSGDGGPAKRVCNQGTCIGPDNCICKEGWIGRNCTTPYCIGTLELVNNTFKCGGQNGNIETKELIYSLKEVNNQNITFTKFGSSVTVNFPTAVKDYLINERGFNSTEVVKVISSVSSSSGPSSEEAYAISSVVTISMFNINDEKIPIVDLEEPIELYFSNLSTAKDTNALLNFTCMFFDNSDKEWKTDGIETTINDLKFSPSSNIVTFSMSCRTSHLTSFAVIDQNYKKANTKGREPENSEPILVNDNTVLIAVVASSVGGVVVVCVAGVLLAVVIALFIRARMKKAKNVA
ncbi:predicted protein [Naegleria gruberi]|uniref:Predicted protein n=1 Tax=Naegleria gruberi TaxID=5762 RepID=D2V7M4_NAEGR|nr:uncharacterized protein NAEGRDRAFT_57397 [Naegleria gruberi]EFC47406.1 predicted protein [Naegleria gruberi]|eukprot:XP_002680150.1 predicted protein [Naegleria gruberi strain NEG-M]